MGRLISAGHSTSCLPKTLPFLFFFFFQGKAGGGQCHQHVLHCASLSLCGFISFPLSKWTLLLFLPWQYGPNEIVQAHTKPGIYKDKNLYLSLPSILLIITLFSLLLIPLPWLLPLQYDPLGIFPSLKKRGLDYGAFSLNIYTHTQTHTFIQTLISIYKYKYIYLFIDL